MKNLEIQIDTKQLEIEKDGVVDYSLSRMFVDFMTILGGRVNTFNPSRQIWVIPSLIQKFGTGFYWFLVQCKKTYALEAIKRLDGCYAKIFPIEKLDQIKYMKSIPSEDETKPPIEEPNWFVHKVSNDGKNVRYIFDSKEMTFGQFIALEGDVCSNKDHGLSKMVDYIVENEGG